MSKYSSLLDPKRFTSLFAFLIVFSSVAFIDEYDKNLSVFNIFSEIISIAKCDAASPRQCPPIPSSTIKNKSPDLFSTIHALSSLLGLTRPGSVFTL